MASASGRPGRDDHANRRAPWKVGHMATCCQCGYYRRVAL